ncbi:hypothetical protein [Hyalangium versicolor]|uniref:hypothetical protein n=1 Tax=Hyalangium versicolor TaxID=2861190 RepID=UPI001CCB11AE|nr:hypothetical protein [Hyalangium versicolor]
MRHRLQRAGVLTASLLAACAVGPRPVRDEGSERIEEAMRPEAHPERIPEGIVLGDDAPPLAPAEPEEGAHPPERGNSLGWPESPSWGYGAPFIIPGPVWGSYPPAVRYHIQAAPGGTVPGLLP